MGAALAGVIGFALAGCRWLPAPASDVLRIGVSYELSTLDPHRQDTLSSSALLSNVYEPLVATDPEMKLVPRLAVMWENPDPRSWVFHLRPGVVFHDGRPFSADDVTATLERIRADAGLGMRKKLSGVDEVRARDAMTLEIRTREPDRTFLQKLAGILILPRGSREGPPAGIGTGAYRLEAWSATRLRLVRFDHYWGAATPFENVEYALGMDLPAALEALRSGRIILAEGQGRGLSAADIASFQIARRESLYTKYLAFDLARPRSPGVPGGPNPFRDRRVRRAIHLALNRSALAARLSTDAVPASQPVPRFVFGFHPGLPEPRYDLERARALLSEAGLPRGFDAVLRTRHILEEPARLVAGELEFLGVRLRVEALPDPDFFEGLRNGDASVWLDRVACISGDAHEYFTDFLHSRDQSRRLGSSNDSGLAEPELDLAIERVAGMEDELDRREALSRLMVRVMEELPVVPLFVDRDVYVYDPRIAFTPRYDSEIRAYEVGRVAGDASQATRAFSAKRDARNGHRS